MNQIVFLVLTGLFISSASFCIDDEKPSTTESRMTTSVIGKVVDKLSGESLAAVAIKFSGNSQVVYTDLEGNFEIKDVIPGTYELEAELISYKRSNNEVKLDQRAENNIRVELENL